MLTLMLTLMAPRFIHIQGFYPLWPERKLWQKRKVADFRPQRVNGGRFLSKLRVIRFKLNWAFIPWRTVPVLIVLASFFGRSTISTSISRCQNGFFSPCINGAKFFPLQQRQMRSQWEVKALQLVSHGNKLRSNITLPYIFILLY